MKVSSFYTRYEMDSEDNSSESQTVPDQSLTVRDILNNYTRGSSLPPIESGEDEDIDGDVYNYSDIVDAHDVVARVANSFEMVDQKSVKASPPSSDNERNDDSNDDSGKSE